MSQTMTDTTTVVELTACPRCDGPWWPKHPAGLLTFQHRTTCPWLAAEDATQHADVQRFRDHVAPEGSCWVGYNILLRPVTTTEREVLGALGWAADAELMAVEWLTDGILRRRPVQ